MEKIKDPAMLLSITDAIALVGISFYFQKQIESLREDLGKITNTMGKLTEKVTSLEKSNKNGDQILIDCKKDINEYKGKISGIMEKIDSISLIEDDIYEISAVMNANKLPIELPSEYRKRSGDRRDSRYPVFQGTQIKGIESEKYNRFDRCERSNRFEKSEPFHNEWSRSSRESERERYEPQKLQSKQNDDSRQFTNRQEFRPDPRQELRQDPRQELRQEPRQELRSEPRQELRSDPRQELRSDPRLDLRQELRSQDINIDDFINEVHDTNK